MSTIFHLNDLDNFEENINIDDLYEKQKDEDLRKLEIYNKILNKLHQKIKKTSRLCKGEPYCWFQVPLMLLGCPEYDAKICIDYLLSKLKSNGFLVNFMKPNLLLISWKDWIPSHVRNEIHNQLGKKIDGYGNLLDTEKDGDKNDESNENKATESKYMSVDNHKTMKNIVYDTSILDKLNKINKSE
tara:strand:- start:155 stop:712 length:558 start_codon:yes stop_codon:yes gene_type:complete